MKGINVTVNENKNGFHIPSEFNKAKLLDWFKEYKWFEVIPLVRESKKQRGFYHAAVCALYAYFHESLDHHSHEDIETVHQWLKLEYNGEYLEINGKAHLIGKSTVRELNNGFLERCIDGLMDNYMIDPEVLNPLKYKHWRDAVYPNGGPDNYIDYMEEIKLLKKPTL